MIRMLDDPLATEADTLRRNAHLYPERPATTFHGRNVDYATMDRYASQVANGVLTLSGDSVARIGYICKNSDYFFETIYGVAKSGHVSLPVNWRLSPREMAFVLRDAEVGILFIDSEYEAIIAEIRETYAGLTQIVVYGETSENTGYVAWRDQQSVTDPMVPVDPEGIFLQVYTSGTTGHPKGVQVSHRASMQMRDVETSTKEPWAHWTHKDIALVQGPNFHVSGVSWAAQWIARGAQVVIHEQSTIDGILLAIRDHGITQMFAVPTVLQMMLEHDLCAGTDFSTMRTIYYGAAPIPPALLTKCLGTFGCDMVQLYGMTETNGVVVCLSPQEHDPNNPERLKSCGKPFPAVDLRIMDGDGVQVSAGVVGEVCIKTPALMNGYWKLDEETKNVMFGDFYRSGDLGRLDEQGYLYLVDRLKDMIVSGGENIYPIEVERALHEHPDVQDVAVIGSKDDKWGETVLAIIVTNKPKVDGDGLIAFLQGKLAKYKMPRRFEQIDVLPRNASGKILKKELRDTFR